MKKEIYFRNDLFRESENGLVLIGCKCKSCGYIAFPKTTFCSKCLSEDVEEIELSKTGTLHTWTVTRVPVDKFPLPHAIGMIYLPEKIRVVAPLIYENKEYTIGCKMKVERAILWSEEDHDVIGYKFRAIEG